MSAEPAPASVAVGKDLERLYRSWRILDCLEAAVDQLPSEWLQILNVARNLMEGNPLPGVQLSEDLRRLLAPAVPTHTTTTRVERKRRIVYPVTGDTRVQPLRNISDLPQATMPDLLLRTISREVFEFQLMSDGINGVYNIEPGPAVEEWDEIIEERTPTGHLNRQRRQRVYALLDVSNSMRDDNKMVMAKAIMLAYLMVACEEQSRVYFRTFANTVHPRTDCLSLQEFREVALRILRLTPDGSTDIRGTVAAAIGDINALDEVGVRREAFDASPTELLLVSDCESYSVPHVPRGIKLHTVHLKSGYMARGYQEGVEQIRKASATFTEIDTTRFVLPETMRDRWLLAQDGRVLQAPSEAPVVEGARLRADRMERRRTLLKAYERLEEARGPRPGQESMFVGRPPSVTPGELWRMFWSAVGQLFRGRGRKKRPASPVASPSFGVKFRLQR
ncbi:MAG TPA: hypothetical protein VIH05_11355 [Tepidiformaceae bacterium]